MHIMVIAALDRPAMRAPHALLLKAGALPQVNKRMNDRRWSCSSRSATCCCGPTRCAMPKVSGLCFLYLLHMLKGAQLKRGAQDGMLRHTMRQCCMLCQSQRSVPATACHNFTPVLT